MSTRQPVVETMDTMMVEVMRNKTPAERLAIAFRMWENARTMITESVRKMHPDWSDDEVEQEIAARMQGRFD